MPMQNWAFFLSQSGATWGDSQKGAGETVTQLPVNGFPVLQRATKYICIAAVFHGCNLTTEDWEDGSQPISMAVMFPFVCLVLSPNNSCMLESKENITQGSRDAPAGCANCLLLSLEGRCCSIL